MDPSGRSFLRTLCSIWFIYDWRSRKGCYSGKYMKVQYTKCEIISCIFPELYNQNILLLVACLFLEYGQAHYWLQPDSQGSAIIAAAYPVLSLAYFGTALDHDHYITANSRNYLLFAEVKLAPYFLLYWYSDTKMLCNVCCQAQWLSFIQGFSCSIHCPRTTNNQTHLNYNNIK